MRFAATDVPLSIRADVGRPILAGVPSGDAFSGGHCRLKAGCGQNARPTSSKLVVTVLCEPQQSREKCCEFSGV